MARTVMTTLCVGDSYRTAWEQCCRKNWEAYAKRHGFDLVAFDAPLDHSERAAKRCPAWQKCLILEALGQYERVVWLDADIVINPQSPSIVDGVPLGKVGGVISGSYIHPDLRALYLTRFRKIAPELAILPQSWQYDQANYYRNAGVVCKSSDIVQTGVLVLDHSHRTLLRTAYDTYPSNTLAYEQFPLSAAMLNAGLHHPLNSRFNVVFYERAIVHYPYLFDQRFRGHPDLTRLAVQTELDNSFFLHFAMARPLMPFADEGPLVVQW